MELMKFLGRGFAGLGLAVAAIFLAGCETDSSYQFNPLAQKSAPADAGFNGGSSAPATVPDSSPNTLTKGDVVIINFTDTPNPIQPMEDTVKDDGSITLIYDQRFQAAGKTTAALQREIRDRYVPKYFKFLTVTIAPKERFYYVGGEVRQPNRFVYSGKMTVNQAIDTAGGFTDFARKGKVKVIRPNGESYDEDCTAALKHPEKDHEIFPGDKIQVPKRLW
jgi:protein involved in polysaccharide export with SLBB domain